MVEAKYPARSVPSARNMTNEDIIRAWKEEGYRSRLTQAQRDSLPDHPSGQINLAALDEWRKNSTQTYTVGNEACCCDHSYVYCIVCSSTDGVSLANDTCVPG